MRDRAKQARRDAREGEAQVDLLAGLGLRADLGQELVDALRNVVCAGEQRRRGERAVSCQREGMTLRAPDPEPRAEQAQNGPKRSRASPCLSASETLYFCCLIENLLAPSSLTSHTRLATDGEGGRKRQGISSRRARLGVSWRLGRKRRRTGWCLRGQGRGRFCGQQAGRVSPADGQPFGGARGRSPGRKGSSDGQAAG